VDEIGGGAAVALEEQEEDEAVEDVELDRGRLEA